MNRFDPRFDTAAFLKGARSTATTFEQTYEVRSRATGNPVGGIGLILQKLVRLVEESIEQLPMASVHLYVSGEPINWGHQSKETSALEARLEAEVDHRVRLKLRALRRSHWALLRALVIGRF